MAAGHQITDMLLGCSYAGKQCNSSIFKIKPSATYGNCFTLEYGKFIARASGPSNGLQLMFYIQTDEYLKGITTDEGLHVVIHPQKSLPFPDEGIAVSSGSNTFVALKLLRVERLGKPYGDCITNEDFFQQYGLDYTRQTCQEFCKQKTIHKKCKCRDETQEEINIWLNVGNIKPCRSESEMACILNITWTFERENEECSCSMPCFETRYSKTVSSRTWPRKEIISLLTTLICSRNSTVCQLVKDKDNLMAEKEFLKLNIYFEDLNYENISEQASYEIVQFVSDVGGTLGLWIGLSILSVFEIVQMLIELVQYMCCCQWRVSRSSNLNKVGGKIDIGLSH